MKKLLDIRCRYWLATMAVKPEFYICDFIAPNLTSQPMRGSHLSLILAKAFGCEIKLYVECGQHVV